MQLFLFFKKHVSHVVQTRFNACACENWKCRKFERDVKEMYRKHSYNLLHSVMNILQGIIRLFRLCIENYTQSILTLKRHGGIFTAIHGNQNSRVRHVPLDDSSCNYLKKLRRMSSNAALCNNELTFVFNLIKHPLSLSGSRWDSDVSWNCVVALTGNMH